MYGAAFYTNICKLLSTLHGGIKHQRPTVKLPLSKVRVRTVLGSCCIVYFSNHVLASFACLHRSP
jgi:hypothetical protein